MKQLLTWAILTLFLASPSGAFAQSIPGPSSVGGSSVTVLPPLPLPTGAATETTLATIDADTSLLSAATHLEEVLHVSGDRGMFPLGVENEDGVVLVTAETGRYGPIAVNRHGNVFVTTLPGGDPFTTRSEIFSIISSVRLLPGTNANNLGKAEESVHANADVGVLKLNIVNEDSDSLSAGTGTSQRYVGTAADRSGRQIVVLQFNDQMTTSGQPVSSPDVASSNQVGVVIQGSVRDDVLAANAGVTTDGDFTFVRVDNFGAEWVALTDSAGARIAADATDGLKVNLGADNDVTIASLPLPSGAATSALQTSTETLITTIDADTGLISAATHLEDVAHITGERGIASLGVANITLASRAGNGDYLNPALSISGAVMSVPAHDTNVSALIRATKAQDEASNGGHVGIPNMVIRADLLVAGAGVSADGDYTFSRVDNRGAQWTHQLEIGTSDFSVDRDNITTASVNLSFGFTSNKIELRSATGNSADICVDYAGGTAVCPAANTAGDYRLEPGQALILDDAAYSSISVIAASGTQTINVTAWN